MPNFKVLERDEIEKPEPGQVLLHAGLAKEALPYLEHMREQHPRDARHWSNLGGAYKHLCRFDESIAAYEMAMRLEPEQKLVPVSNLGLVMEELGRFHEAEKLFREANQLLKTIDMEKAARAKYDPWGIPYTWAISLLRLGRYLEAWQPWEDSRIRVSYPVIPGLEKWHGQDLKGKRIVIIHEGGHGDQFLYARYARVLKAEGAHVAWYGMKTQKELFLDVLDDLGIDQWIDERDDSKMEDFDYYIPLWSIMAVINQPVMEVPTPYFRAKGERRYPFPAVGLCCRAGEITNVWRPYKSVEPMGLRDILSEVPVNWVCLDMDDCPPWAEDVSATLRKGWHETASIIAGLDLVITVETAISTLAPALGVPTWVMAPLNRSWFFGLPGSDVAQRWFPQWRIFSNTDPVSYEPVLKEVAAALRLDYGAGARNVNACTSATSVAV